MMQSPHMAWKVEITISRNYYYYILHVVSTLTHPNEVVLRQDLADGRKLFLSTFMVTLLTYLFICRFTQLMPAKNMPLLATQDALIEKANNDR